jgi:hypothetical protein
MTMAKGGKPKPRATGSISLDQTPPVSKMDTLTFTWNIDGLSGQEYPMVYLVVEVDDVLVYGRLDHPEPQYNPWVIGEGSCPWLDPSNPAYGRDGMGHAELWVYVPFRQQDAGNVYRVATTPEFVVTW